jgi:hypothetical protein
MPLYPAPHDDAVDSVNGQTGVVVLAAGDVGAAAVSHTHLASDVTDFDSTITGKPTVTADGADYVIISDTSDSGSLKKALASDLGGSGSGDVVGPASSTDNAIARFDSTTGKILQNSAVTVNDGGDLVTSGEINAGGATLLDGDVLASGRVQTDTIDEYDTDAGVTIDGVLIKDGLVDGVDVSLLSGNTEMGFQNEELTSTYAYVGYEHATDGSWYIYRRTRSSGVREYATGASSYATNWTGRAGLTYV